MATEEITQRNFKPDSLALIDQANEIIAEYEGQGFKLTLRQIYYQFVARDLIPNTMQSYKRLGSVINDARLAGMIDWEMIEDRTRGVEVRSRWTSPRAGIEALRNQYHIDMWANQPKRVEVWIEKEALVGVIEGICNSFDVPYLACRGYVSQSEQWRAYRRIFEYYEGDPQQETVILHLGDHDPSGIDMTRDNGDRLTLFLNSAMGLYPNEEQDAVTVERLALNRDQIDRYKPPPNPAKMTDSRFGGYSAIHGAKSWELDALEPKVLTELIRKHILLNIDPDKWNERMKQLKEEQATLDKIIKGLK
jgi:hypothetical protein